MLISKIPALKDMQVGSPIVNSLNKNSGFESNIERAALYCDEDSPELWRLAASFTNTTENSVVRAIIGVIHYRRLLAAGAFALKKYTLAIMFLNVAQDMDELSNDYVDIITNGKGGDNDAVIRADLQKYPNNSNSKNFKVKKTNHLEETSAGRAYDKLQDALEEVGISQPPPPLQARISPSASASQLGNSTKFKAKASGGIGSYSYTWYWRWTGTLVPIKTGWTKFGSSSKVTFSPWQSKELKLEVTDSQGTKVEDIETW